MSDAIFLMLFMTFWSAYWFYLGQLWEQPGTQLMRWTKAAGWFVAMIFGLMVLYVIVSALV